MNLLPPLKSLVAFDAAMKRNSFALAAADLSVTPGAVGQQIRILEDWLGLPLFIREIRQVRPTVEAQAYWKEIQPALAQIRRATKELRQTQAMEVRLSMPPGFAAKWFARRMADFVASHPEIAMYLSSSAVMVDFVHEPFDLAIRYFDGNDENLESILLWQDEARVYCAPAYAHHHRLKHPADLKRATLLHNTMHPYWKTWLTHYSGLDEVQIAAIPGIHFDQSLLALEAARREQGVMLSSVALTEEETANATLVELFGLPLKLQKGFYVVNDRRKPLRPAAAVLKEWFIEKYRS